MHWYSLFYVLTVILWVAGVAFLVYKTYDIFDRDEQVFYGFIYSMWLMQLLWICHCVVTYYVG